MYEPTKIVRLARPGEVSGHRGAVDEPTKAYLEAAELAMDHPGVPVLVHEWNWPNDEDSTIAAINRHAASEAKAEMLRINTWDRLGEADAGRTIPDDCERFHVGSNKVAKESLHRTFVVFHPEGRPVRERKGKKGSPEAEADAATEA